MQHINPPPTEHTKNTWWESESTNKVDVKEFEKLCRDLKQQKDLVDKIKDRQKTETQTLEKMKTKMIAYLEEFGKSKYSTDFGTIYTTTKFSVKVPKDEEQKEKLFSFLREKGIFEQYATVNSNSLNSLYKAFLESEGEDFAMPGVSEPTYYKTLNIRSN